MSNRFHVATRKGLFTYEKKDGTQGFSAEMVADTFDFVGPRETAQSTERSGGQGTDFDSLPF